MPASNGLPRNLLVARFSALGDVAMTIPVVYSACRCNPDTRFIFITKPVQESLFINPPRKPRGDRGRCEKRVQDPA